MNQRKNFKSLCVKFMISISKFKTPTEVHNKHYRNKSWVSVNNRFGFYLFFGQ